MTGPLISDQYRAQNAALHRTNRKYGANGHEWTDRVIGYLGNADTYLDYGCGKGQLSAAVAEFAAKNNLGLKVSKYDPVTAPELPEPAQFVTCCDVLEHVEPDLLANVLDHIKSLIVAHEEFPHNTGRALLVISLRPSNKRLPDGRNAHLIVKRGEWWLSKLSDRFSEVSVVDPIRPKRVGKELAVLVKP